MDASKAKLKDKIRTAQIAVAVARAKWETVNEADKETKISVLSSGKYCKEDNGEVITNPRDDFMMTTEDFTEYCKEVYAANCAKGLDTGSWEQNFWPIQKAVYTAEDALLDLIPSCIPGIDEATHKKMREYPNREKALDLIFTLDTRTIPETL